MNRQKDPSDHTIRHPLPSLSILEGSCWPQRKSPSVFLLSEGNGVVFFQTCTPKNDQRWLSKDFMVPFRSISSPHPWFGQVSNIHWDAILHATRPSPPWSPCLWLNFGSGCASDEFQKVENSWGINERHFKKSNKPPRHTYFYTHLVEIY